MGQRYPPPQGVDVSRRDIMAGAIRMRGVSSASVVSLSANSVILRRCLRKLHAELESLSPGVFIGGRADRVGFLHYLYEPRFLSKEAAAPWSADPDVSVGSFCVPFEVLIGAGQAIT
jgi:hypothetical protein